LLPNEDPRGVTGDRAQIGKDAKGQGRERDDVRPAAFAEHARDGPRLRVLVDVRPAHVQGLAASGAEQEQELDRARDDKPRGLLAVLEDRIASAGRDRIEGFPNLLDLVVGEDTFSGVLRTEALEAGGGIALDQFFAQAPTERGANQRQGPVGSNRGLAGDSLQEGAQLTASHLLGSLQPCSGSARCLRPVSPTSRLRCGSSGS
jgi:hypothetical protein